LKAELIEQQLPTRTSTTSSCRTRLGELRRREGRNQGIAHLKTSVGSGLNKALAAVEDANPNTLQDVSRASTSIAASASGPWTTAPWSSSSSTSTTATGQRRLRVPDLLGAAYEYLIKYFADSAGKKGGEFYTLPRSSDCWFS